MTANRIIQHIFHTPDMKQVDETDFDRLISTYPYFTAARLLLAKKQYAEQKNLLAPAVKKAQQYSTNMHYFYRFITTEEKEVAPEPVVMPVFEAPVVVMPEPAPVAETPAAVVPEPAPVAATPEPVSTPAPVDETPVAVVPEPAPVAAAPEQVPTPAPVAASNETTNQEPIKIFPLEIPREESTLTFQPLYSDDYFAYKRLKDPEHAEVISDKGAAEMKSFTSWLKDLKHNFVEKANKDWYHEQLHRSYQDANPEVSETVEKMAIESITLNNDIVSETLAEVWARQHQYKTAINIYQKLSLLNPDKSAYFAQKIKELQLLTEKN